MASRVDSGNLAHPHLGRLQHRTSPPGVRRPRAAASRTKAATIPRFADRLCYVRAASDITTPTSRVALPC